MSVFEIESEVRRARERQQKIREGKRAGHICKWDSSLVTNNREDCTRKVIQGADYCLFHKPNKNKSEATEFWKIINYPNYKEAFNTFTHGPRNWHKDLHYFVDYKIGPKNIGDFRGFIFPKGLMKFSV